MSEKATNPDSQQFHKKSGGEEHVPSMLPLHFNNYPSENLISVKLQISVFLFHVFILLLQS